MEVETNTVMTLEACQQLTSFSPHPFSSWQGKRVSILTRESIKTNTLVSTMLKECHPSPWKDVATFLTTLSGWSTHASNR